MIEIKTYQEEFLDKQVEIGTKVIGDWTFGAQSGKEQLQQTYSGEGFDPETRLYAFKDGEMVGFLPSSIQNSEEDGPVVARMELPLVLPGHEEVRDQLHDHAIEVLKSKGVEVIRTRAGPDWGFTLDYAEQKGYEKKDPIVRRGIYEMSNWDHQEPGFDVVDLDFERDQKAIRSMFERFYPNVPTPAIDNAMKQLQEGTGVQFLTQKLVKDDDGQILGRLTAYKQDEKDDLVLLGSMISFEGEDQQEIEQALMKSVFNELQDLDVKKVLVTLSGANIQADEKYQLLNLEIKPAVSFYEKSVIN